MKSKKLWASIPSLNEFGPAQREQALLSIKYTDPTVWKRGFELQEVKPSGWCNFSNAIVLEEPLGDDFDYMLMRFSGEDMGEYTTTAEIFRKDKQEAKDYFARQRGLMPPEEVATPSSPRDEAS